LSKVSEILEGWGNVIKDSFGTLDPGIKSLSKSRMLMCDDCEIRVGNVCAPYKQGKHIETGEMTGGCGCALIAKTLSLDSECPLGKW
jgi:hypothetical protein